MPETRSRARSVCLVALISLFATALPALAQVAAGEITGIIQDQVGGAVPGATVTVTNIATNQQRIATSTGDGVYTAASLPPGDYRIDITLSGFKPLRREGVTIATGEKARIDFALAVGDVREQVTVVGNTPIVRTETASLGTVVEHEQVVQLPLNGRLFISLAALAPGVALPPNSPLPRINGGRPRTNEYLFDGISVLQPEPGQVAFFPVVDAIQEFKIESNSPAAEFGRFNGGVVNLTTKAGTNCVSWRWIRVPAQRGAQRQKLLSAGHRDEARLPSQPVRRDARRTADEEPHVLLRRLSGTTAVDCEDGHVDRSHGAAASGNLHRSDRGTCSGYLRSVHAGWHRASRRFRTAPFRRPRWIPLRSRSCSGIRCRRPREPRNNYSRTANEVDGPGPVGCRGSIIALRDRDQAVRPSLPLCGNSDSCGSRCRMAVARLRRAVSPSGPRTRATGHLRRTISTFSRQAC